MARRLIARSQAVRCSRASAVSGSQTTSGTSVSASPIAAISTSRWSLSPGSPQYSGLCGLLPFVSPRRYRSQSAKSPPPAARGTSPHSGRANPSSSAACWSKCAAVEPIRTRAPPGLKYGFSGAARARTAACTSLRVRNSLSASGLNIASLLRQYRRPLSNTGGCDAGTGRCASPVARTLCRVALAINPRLPQIWHGGDYNPEQWPSATWDDDMRLMQAAHFNVATVGVFAWVALQPAEDRFTFDWLDTVLDKLGAAGRFVCLATPSMAQPAWMSRAY